VILACLLTDLSGELTPDPEEATDAAWFLPEDFPNQGPSMQRTMADIAAFEATGQMQVY
jgi:hypothetical protein